MSCTCGCCDGVRTHTPADIFNPPGQDSVDYRVGTHGALRESMIARLSSRPELAGLRTRDGDDPSIALLDCFAMIGDVLTFYQERIANEGYLRTAREKASLTELGRLVGYRPRPALGASTHVAYTLDPGARTVIPAGSGVKSVPRQDELPQTFETSEDLDAREEWNSLRPVMTRPPAMTYYGPDRGITTRPDDIVAIPDITIGGSAANVRAGDRLLFLFGWNHEPVGDDERFGAVVRVVADSTPDFTAATTAVTLLSGRDPFEAALETLLHAVARADDAAGNNVDTLVREHLKRLRNRLDSDPPTPAEIFSNVLGPFDSEPLPAVLDRFAEAGALASVHAPLAVVGWYGDQVREVVAAGDDVVALAESLTRRAPGVLMSTRFLAHRTLCPPSPSRRTLTDCDDGMALAALIPVLPWLRRAPSVPPRTSRQSNPIVAQLFRPDSDVHAKILGAVDPRLSPNLHTAWAHEQVTAPSALSSAQVLRTRAKIARASDTETVYLDAVYDAILAGSWVVIGTSTVRRVVSVHQENRTETIGESDVDIPATVLVLDQRVQIGASTPLFGQGEPLTVVGDPRTDDIAGAAIELDRVYEGLQPGRWLVVSGERTDVPFTDGIHAAELTMVGGVRQRVDPDTPGSPVRTFLELTGELSYRYRRDTVTVYANVVAATQGETRTEILGSGDAGKPNQSFPIRQANQDHPITALPADNPAGFTDALDVSVSGVRWQPTEALAAAAEHDHVYRAVVEADKSVQIHFGDGMHGARPQAGAANITARVRVGAGGCGNVVAGQITELAMRPLGVSAVVNPIAASGGTDGDDADTARGSTPLGMFALDRVISVRDYEDLTRSRVGIGKAKAGKLFDGSRRVVHVTIAGVGDVPIDPVSGLFTALEDALTDYGDVAEPVRVDVRALILLVMRAGINVAPDHSWELVEPAIRAALHDTFSFTRRDLAQDAYLSEAVAAAQSVPGVDYVDVDVFHGIPGSVTPVELLTLVDALNRADRIVHARAARFTVDRVTLAPNETLSQLALRVGLTVEELCRLNPALTSPDLSGVGSLAVHRGIRPAEIVVLNPAVPETLTLRRIP